MRFRHVVDPNTETDRTAHASAVVVDDVPVFDCRQRQMGWLIDSARARSSMGDSSTGFMHYCMNAAVRWSPRGVEENNALLNANSLRRIPVADPQGRISGIVVLPGATRKAEAIVETPLRGTS